MQKPILYNSPVASITQSDNGIFILKLKDTYEAYNQIELEKQLDFIAKHSKGKAYKVFIDATESINIPTDEAGLYFRERNNYENKFAFASGNLPFQIFIGQLIIHREVINMKLFKSTKEAIDWLLKNSSNK